MSDTHIEGDHKADWETFQREYQSLGGGEGVPVEIMRKVYDRWLDEPASTNLALIEWLTIIPTMTADEIADIVSELYPTMI